MHANPIFGVAVAFLCTQIFFCFRPQISHAGVKTRDLDVTSRFFGVSAERKTKYWITFFSRRKIYCDLSSPISSCGEPKMLLMSPRTTVVCFFSVFLAFCSSLEFEERGKCEIRLKANWNARLVSLTAGFNRTYVRKCLVFEEILPIYATNRVFRLLDTQTSQ